MFAASGAADDAAGDDAAGDDVDGLADAEGDDDADGDVAGCPPLEPQPLSTTPDKIVRLSAAEKTTRMNRPDLVFRWSNLPNSSLFCVESTSARLARAVQLTARPETLRDRRRLSWRRGHHVPCCQYCQREI